MLEHWLGRLAQIAGKMNALVKSEDAVIQFDLMAGGLWWSDERPDFTEAEDAWCLRPVFRYRTSLILNAPERQHLPFWDEALRQFPRWPGFAAERCTPNDHLADLYRRKNRAGLLSVELVDILCRLQKEFMGKVPERAIERRAYRRELADITVGEVHDLICRYMRRAGTEAPCDSWERVRRSVAEAMGTEPERIARETGLASLLGEA